MLGLLVAFPASAQEGAFCEDASTCQASEACVAGRCTPIAVGQVRLLFPIAVDKVFDEDTGSRRGPVPEQVDEHLRRLLDVAGVFVVLPPERNPSGAPFEGHRITTIDFQAWYDAGAYAFVKGTVRRAAPGRLTLSLKLFIAEEGIDHPLAADVQEMPEGDAAALKLAVSRWVDALLVDFTGSGFPPMRRIAFARRMDKMGPKEIWVMDSDGGNERPVTQNGAINMLPSWTRDGHVAYTSFVADNPDAYVEGKKLSGRPRMNTGLAFHPDGQQAAITLSMEGNAEIYILDARTGDIRRRLTDNNAIDTSPTWSPDGRRIAFLSDRDTGQPLIYVMNADGSEAFRPPQVGGYNTSPDWSPAGDEIAYSAMVGGDRFDVFSINLKTQVVARLTSGGTGEEPCYSADGRFIVYAGIKNGRRQLWIMNADGRNKRQISRGPGDYFTPAWER